MYCFYSKKSTLNSSTIPFLSWSNRVYPAVCCKNVISEADSLYLSRLISKFRYSEGGSEGPMFCVLMFFELNFVSEFWFKVLVHAKILCFGICLYLPLVQMSQSRRVEEVTCPSTVLFISVLLLLGSKPTEDMILFSGSNSIIYIMP
jgi:hypothetical protein